jgi:hypothetical protein
VKAINYSLGGTKQGDERAKNIINALAPRFIKVERDLGVQVQLNLAAWGGRYTGAMGGFDFATPTQLHHYQRTFRKYLRDQAWLPKGEPRQDVDELIGSLYFQRSNGVREPFSFERLQHTWDFAQVKSSKGKVSLDLNLGDRVVKKPSPWIWGRASCSETRRSISPSRTGCGSRARPRRGRRGCSSSTPMRRPALPPSLRRQRMQRLQRRSGALRRQPRKRRRRRWTRSNVPYLPGRRSRRR